MTTTSSATRRGLRAIQHDIHAAEKAITASETPLDADLRAKMTERFGAERIAQMDADTVVYVAEQRARIAALLVEEAEMAKVMCHRCEGSGLYDGPTTYTRRGLPVCFYCHGSGRHS